MMNKLTGFIRKHQLVQEGDTVICAVSGGADSVALLWAMYLLQDKLKICVEAAHFNHGLRGEESDRDEAFVASLCDQFDIPLHVGRKNVVAGEKGLEAAARNARYAFFNGLSGKVATAHTADDNAETVLMHLIRGTGLKGLGGITPAREKLIRPMLSVTRQDVLAFLEEYHLSFVEDSSNESDDFLRNRIRHHVMPVLKQENPSFSVSISQMALRLRDDEQELDNLTKQAMTHEVEPLRGLASGIRNRVLGRILEGFGVKEPSAEHIMLLEKLVLSENPSAVASFPGNIKIGRVYNFLEKIETTDFIFYNLPIPGELKLPALGLAIEIREKADKTAAFTFVPNGNVVIRSRQAGDLISLPGGTKSLKKLFVDRKIPAAKRNRIPVIADDGGVVAACGVAVNVKRINSGENAVGVWLKEI